jgi:tetratricopeptide (TPR) repeat protein
VLVVGLALAGCAGQTAARDTGRDALAACIAKATPSVLPARIPVCSQALDSGTLTESERADALTMRGAAYMLTPAFDKALADYDGVVRLRPGNAIAYTNRGGAYVAKLQFDSALKDFDRALALEPDYATALRNRGAAYVGLDEPRRAIADLNRAIALAPNDAGIYGNRGYAYIELGQYDRALHDFDIEIARAPASAGAHLRRAEAYYRKGDLVQARAECAEAIRLDSDHDGTIGYQLPHRSFKCAAAGPSE